VWLVEFYAPWCTHCIKSTAAWKQTADRLDGQIEFGAVNGVSNRALLGRFSIQAYPSILLFAPEWDVQAQFHWRGPATLVDDLPPWATGMVAEWQALFANTRVERHLAGAVAEAMAASPLMWVVMFTTTACGACSDAKPNFYRLSRELAGMAVVAVVDCAGGEAMAHCVALGVPPGGDGGAFPHFLVFPIGAKSAEGIKGEVLYSAKEQESHLVMPLIARVLRAATAEARKGAEVGAPATDSLGDFEKEKEDPPPPPPPTPPPPANYHAPPPKNNFAQLPPAQRNRHPQIA
jgi:thiol-disulfide isomerase/thioredoxin